MHAPGSTHNGLKLEVSYIILNVNMYIEGGFWGCKNLQYNLSDTWHLALYLPSLVILVTKPLKMPL